MLTLEEAIEHLKETLNNPEHEWSCAECKAEHEQLLEWLKELKALRHTVSLLKFNIHALNELLKESDNEIDN